MAEASACKGVQEVSLHVSPHNAPALQLYRKAGFEPEAEQRRDYYGAGQPAWVMILPLKNDESACRCSDLVPLRGMFVSMCLPGS